MKSSKPGCNSSLSKESALARYDQLAQFLKGAADKGAKRIRVHFLTVCTSGTVPFLACLHFKPRK